MEARKCCVEQEYKTISKRSNVSFRRKIKEKLNNKSSSELKTLTFHALLDEWLEYHIKHQVQS